MTILAKFKKLNRRERYAIVAGVAIIGLFLVAIFVVEPFLSGLDQRKRNLQAKAVMLEEMERLQAEYATLTEKAAVSKSRFSQRQRGFTLFSFLERLAGDAGIKDRISYMKPSKKVQKNNRYKISRVEMKLEAITLEQLTKFLYDVETSENMVDINKVAISKTEKTQGLINAVLQVETIEI